MSVKGRQNSCPFLFIRSFYERKEKMPTISVDKNDLMQLIGRDYSVEQLEDL
ncbi:hypothetical protein KKH56_01780, partial [bacterium]|nr:hypothetical protein [bacterium]